MPSGEVRHRRGRPAAPQDGEPHGPSEPSCRAEGRKAGGGRAEGGAAQLCPAVEPRTAVSVASLCVCLLLAWVVAHQNARFNEVEEKYRRLHEKAAELLVLEERLGAVSRKLEASEDHLKGALSSVTAATRLEKDITSLNAAVTAMQEDQDASSSRLQKVNERFLNVTEAWQKGLGAVTDELATLRSESRSVHSRVTERVNEAEGRLRALAERLEEVEDGTRRNARLLERTEEEDAKHLQSHLDWNTGQLGRLQEQLKQLSRNDVELQEKLVEIEPRAKECEAHLPTVEDAVRSILRLGADLSSTERRIEELTLQVLGTEDSMLKALSEILALRQALDDLQVDASVTKVNNELGVMLEAMKELNGLQREAPLPEDGIDFERSSLADLGDAESVEQLRNTLKEFERKTFLESALDHSESPNVGAEEDPMNELK